MRGRPIGTRSGTFSASSLRSCSSAKHRYQIISSVAMIGVIAFVVALLSPQELGGDEGRVAVLDIGAVVRRAHAES
jgi:hypothetical protein